MAWAPRADLDARLAEVDAPGQLLAHEGVGVVRALEHALQRLQLAAVERGAVPPLLLLPLGGAAAAGTGTLTCGEAGGQPAVSPGAAVSRDSCRIALHSAFCTAAVLCLPLQTEREPGRSFIRPSRCSHPCCRPGAGLWDRTVSPSSEKSDLGATARARGTGVAPSRT
jgi:hypothetical protein